MRVVIGDMEFEDKATVWSGGTSADTLSSLNAGGSRALKERLDAFLGLAQACYIERHGLKPERTTVEEF